MNFAWLYVGTIYALVVWRADVPRRVAVLFYFLVLAFLWRPLTQQVVIVPADVLKLTAPWSELRAPNRPAVTKYEVSNLNLHDVPMQIVPWMQQTREAWLWNPAAGCGMPLLANGQSTPLSPLRWLARPLPLGFAIAAEAAMKLLLALTLTYLFCRTRYSVLASVIAAIAYGFSTWMTTWLQFPIAAAAAFLPGVMLAIDRLLEGFTPKRFVAATLVFAATVLSGHPETVYDVGLIAAAYAGWRQFVERGTRNALLRSVFRVPRSVFHLAGAAFVAALIASPFLVPFAEAVVRSQRLAEARAPRASLTPPYSDFNSAVLLLQPRFFGELPIERPWGPTSLESVCGFAGVLSLASVIAAAIFMVMRRRWRERETLYVLGFLLSLGIVLGWPLITPVFHAVAGLAPAMRMRLGICWFASLLVAAAIDASRRDTRVPLLVGTLAVAAAMMALLRTVPFPTDGHRISAILSLLPSIAVLAALLIPRFEIAAALTVVELFVTMSSWNPVLPLREMYPKTPMIKALQRLDRGARIVGTGSQLYPNTGAMFGFEDVRVHDPMANARYVGLLAREVGWDANNYYAKWNDTGTPLLDALNVKYVVTEPWRELPPPRYRLLYTGGDGRIYENRTVKPRFFSSDAEVEIVRARSDAYSLRIRAAREAFIDSSIAFYPGWRVRGATRVETGGVFLGFFVPAGRHDIEVRYRPASFYVSSAVALLTIGTLLVLSRRRPADRPR
jgi:hypothetical protein